MEPTEEKKRKTVTINIPIETSLRLKLYVIKRSHEVGKKLLEKDVAAEILNAALPQLEF